MNAVIVHGMPTKEEYFDKTLPSESNKHWLPWLQKQLSLNGILAQTPEMPRAYDPSYDEWAKEFERFHIVPGTNLVGHSCGGGFLVRWLSEHSDIQVGNVVLVAPWMDPDKDETRGFFDFRIDPGILGRCKKLVVFNSDNDSPNVIKSVAMLRESIPEIAYREFRNYGHFCYDDMHTAEFPELLSEVLD